MSYYCQSASKNSLATVITNATLVGVKKSKRTRFFVYKRLTQKSCLRYPTCLIIVYGSSSWLRVNGFVGRLIFVIGDFPSKLLCIWRLNFTLSTSINYIKRICDKEQCFLFLFFGLVKWVCQNGEYICFSKTHNF